MGIFGVKGHMKDLVLEKASDLFFSKGYKAASLQALADELGIKPASLYYYYPGGKEEIYISVLKAHLQAYKDKTASLAKLNQSMESFLKQFAHWFVLQPSMNMALISQMDMPYLSPKGKQVVMKMVQDSIFLPLAQVLSQYSDQMKNIDTMRVVGIYVTLLNGMNLSIKQGYVSADRLVEEFMEIMLRGVLK